ncbi:hypothetical protein CesoFtcFv8_025414 [Champsocephalus esox]|uniref:Uncharacterized protein n=1 Tax=Champsocephalus esox TaxID=159716 RepID=A0AAN8GF14_9TELE|nr:hypothetical protein CesoFtcFv8_025414 [Champsocephalus esox]
MNSLLAGGGDNATRCSERVSPAGISDVKEKEREEGEEEGKEDEEEGNEDEEEGNEVEEEGKVDEERGVGDEERGGVEDAAVDVMMDSRETVDDAGAVDKAASLAVALL